MVQKTCFSLKEKAASEWTGLFANKQTQTKNKTWKGTQYNILSTQSTYTSQWHCKEQLTAQSFRTTGGFLRLTSSIAKKLVLFQSHFWGKKLQKHGEEVETRNDPLKTDTFCVLYVERVPYCLVDMWPARILEREYLSGRLFGNFEQFFCG